MKLGNVRGLEQVIKMIHLVSWHRRLRNLQHVERHVYVKQLMKVEYSVSFDNLYVLSLHTL